MQKLKTLKKLSKRNSKGKIFSAELITKDLSPIDNLERSLQHAEAEVPRVL